MYVCMYVCTRVLPSISIDEGVFVSTNFLLNLQKFWICFVEPDVWAALQKFWICFVGSDVLDGLMVPSWLWNVVLGASWDQVSPGTAFWTA